MYRMLLSIFIRAHRIAFDRVMYHLAPKCYGGSHPKNIFHYRSEFFIENVHSDEVVLDIACGQGAILKQLAAKIKKGIGVDQNPRMLALAREKSPGNLVFLEGDINGPLIGQLLHAEGITKVVLSHILEHLPDPVNFLRQLDKREVLICVPSEENWYRQLLKDLGINHLSDPTHFREYTRSLLKEHLMAAGYRSISTGFNAEGEIVCRASG